MPKPKPKKPSPKKPAPPPRAAAAFADIKAELNALKQDDLARINIDIPTSVATVLGVLPKLALLRDSIVLNLPNHPIKTFDRLETYALAAWYAHLIALPPASPSSPVKPLIEEGTSLRAALLSDAEALARRGLIDADVVEEIRSGHGNVDIANDLVALSATFSNSWSEIEGKTAATLAEVERAGNLGPQLLAALGVREQGSAIAPAEAAEARARAYTLFVRAYDDTRRAVLYLRWHEGDADALAPSLYKGRGGRGSSASETSTEEEPSEGAPAVGEAPAGG
jgi:hypothetical protein